MANCRIPNVLVYVREKGGKRSFYPAPSNPDLIACYRLRYEKDGKLAWQRVGHYDLVKREKLLLERRLSAAAQGSSFQKTSPLQERRSPASRFRPLWTPTWSRVIRAQTKRNTSTEGSEASLISDWTAAVTLGGKQFRKVLHIRYSQKGPKRNGTIHLNAGAPTQGA
jgi:hypothetical protein